MDKKMAKVTKEVVKAEKILKHAEKANRKLTAIDKNVRDPKIEKCDKVKKAHPKDFKK